MQTILYLDDSNSALKLFERFLKDCVHVVCCSSVAEATALMMERSDIDCFVLDYMLPDGDGISFGREVRAIERYAETPIILLSATSTPDIAHLAMRSGINQCVSKVISRDGIKAIINAQLEKPTIHKVDRVQIDISCVGWEADRVFYQYSPDTGDTVSGSSQDEAQLKMSELLRKHVLEKGKNWENVLDVSVTHHRFDV